MPERTPTTKAGLATDIANLRKVLPTVVATIEREAAQQELDRAYLAISERMVTEDGGQQWTRKQVYDFITRVFADLGASATPEREKPPEDWGPGPLGQQTLPSGGRP